MSIWIELATNPAMEQDAARVREEVFGREWNVALPDLGVHDSERRLTLVARAADNKPVATLTVLETTGDAALHHRLGLAFAAGARAARYTQLAVLKEYRGRNLPVRLILEARRRFVDPGQIGFTWLLFDAGRANSSSLCRLLGFTASSRKYLTEYGCSRVLLRDETSHAARLADQKAAAFLARTDRTGMAIEAAA